MPILKCTAEDGTTGQTAQPSYDVEQINSTFAYGGPGCLWETVEQTTGIHINDFVELNFVGFEKVIDALHGVEICLPQAVDDPKSRLNLKAGRHHVYGREALAFWRTREDLGMGDDPQRIQRDQFLMASLVQGIEHSGLLKSPSTMLRVIDTLTGNRYVTTDSGLTPDTMLRIGEDLRGISTESVQFVTVPWGTYAGNAQWIDSSQSPSTGNSAWIQWSQPQANNLFSAIAHDTKLPKAGKKSKVKTVSPASVDVKVLNGTSYPGARRQHGHEPGQPRLPHRGSGVRRADRHVYDDGHRVPRGRQPARRRDPGRAVQDRHAEAGCPSARGSSAPDHRIHLYVAERRPAAAAAASRTWRKRTAELPETRISARTRRRSPGRTADSGLVFTDNYPGSVKMRPEMPVPAFPALLRSDLP